MTNFYKLLYSLENTLPASAQILLYDDVNDAIRAISNGRYMYSGITPKARQIVANSLKTITDTKGIPDSSKYYFLIGNDAFNPIADKKQPEYTAVFISEYGTIFVYGNTMPFQSEIEKIPVVLNFANEITRQMF